MSDEPWTFISIDLGTAEMSREEMWPDGDAPENPTAEDVADVIRRCGGLRSVVSDWDLLYDARVTVRSNPGGGAETSMTTLTIR